MKNKIEEQLKEIKLRQDEFFKSYFSNIVGVSWGWNKEKNCVRWGRAPAAGDSGNTFALKADAEDEALKKGKVKLSNEEWIDKCRYAASLSQVLTVKKRDIKRIISKKEFKDEESSERDLLAPIRYRNAAKNTPEGKRKLEEEKKKQDGITEFEKKAQTIMNNQAWVNRHRGGKGSGWNYK